MNQGGSTPTSKSRKEQHHRVDSGPAGGLRHLVEQTTMGPGLGRSPGGGHGDPLQYSCLENPMDRGAWRAIVHGVAKSRAQVSH